MKSLVEGDYGSRIVNRSCALASNAVIHRPVLDVSGGLVLQELYLNVSKLGRCCKPKVVSVYIFLDELGAYKIRFSRKPTVAVGGRFGSQANRSESALDPLC